MPPPPLPPGAAALDVLVVDDCKPIVTIMTMMLMRQGHSVATADHGQHALQRVTERWERTGRGFDVVLMDIYMPIMNGVEATVAIRALEERWLRGRPREKVEERVDGLCAGECSERDAASQRGGETRSVIIAVSAGYGSELTENALEAGCDAFMNKPFKLEEFNAIYLSLTAHR